MSSSIPNSLQTTDTNSVSDDRKDLYVHEIPALERHKLCAILDISDVWLELANKMGYKAANILSNVRRASQSGNSPSDELLTMWSEHNHTVTELYILLHRMKHYAAMDTIRNLVETKYQQLIPSSFQENQSSGQPDWSQILPNSNDRKKLNISQSRNNNNISEVMDSMSISNTDSSSVYENSLKIKYTKYAGRTPHIDYSELTDATNKWDKNQILGRGGFGTVYKGIWKLTPVAIKRIEYNERHGSTATINKIQLEQSLNEMKHLNSYQHDNILPLYGYCINNNEQCLIYQLMAGGSLEQRLRVSNNIPRLTWEQRLTIAQGTARGLQFLHTLHNKPLIHGDIKPGNILLDPCCIPKIGDFGLAREGPNPLDSSMEVSRVYGTRPYLPLEFLFSKALSTKVDTYSFGIVMLELATGLRALDKDREHQHLIKHVLTKLIENAPVQELMDKNLPKNETTINIAQTFIDLGKMCVAERPDSRPEMVVVLGHLLHVNFGNNACPKINM